MKKPSVSILRLLIVPDLLGLDVVSSCSNLLTTRRRSSEELPEHQDCGTDVNPNSDIERAREAVFSIRFTEPYRTGITYAVKDSIG